MLWFLGTVRVTSTAIGLLENVQDLTARRSIKDHLSVREFEGVHLFDYTSFLIVSPALPGAAQQSHLRL